MDKRHAMVIRADARAMGAVTATRVGGERKRARTHQKFSPVLVTRADGSQSVITRTRTTDGRSKKVYVPVQRDIRMVNGVPTLVDAVTTRSTSADLRPINAD